MPRADLDHPHRTRRDPDRATTAFRPVRQRSQRVRLQLHWREDARVARWSLVVVAIAFEVWEIVRACH